MLYDFPAQQAANAVFVRKLRTCSGGLFLCSACPLSDRNKTVVPSCLNFVYCGCVKRSSEVHIKYPTANNACAEAEFCSATISPVSLYLGHYPN